MKKTIAIILVALLIGAGSALLIQKAISEPGNTVAIMRLNQNTGASTFWDTLPAWSPIGPAIWKAYRVEPGDMNGDGKVGTADLVYLYNYIFRAGPEPVYDTNITYSLEVGTNEIAFLLQYDGQTFVMPIGEFIAVKEDK